MRSPVSPILYPSVDHVGGNGPTGATRDFDRAVIGVDTQRRLRANVVGFRPVVAERRQGQQRESEEKNDNEFSHRLLHEIVRRGAGAGSVRKERVASGARGMPFQRSGNQLHAPRGHRSLHSHRRRRNGRVSGAATSGIASAALPLCGPIGPQDMNSLATRNAFLYRLYWFCFFSAWRSRPNSMSRSMSWE